MRGTLSALIGFVLLVFPAQAQNENWSVDRAIKAVIEDAIRPGFARFDDHATKAAQSVNTLCETPSDQSLDAARIAFSDLVEAWGHVEFVRIGPLSADNRLERILFWPDRRGRGLKQVRDIIRTDDVSASAAESLGGKSVAVQGLLALEFVLFDDASDALATGDAFRCAYGRAIAENIEARAGELTTAWEDPDGIAALWLSPSSDNPLFRDESEQIKTLLQLIGDGAEIIKVQRLDPFLGETQESVKPKSAIFWRSGQTLNLLSANFEGLKAIVEAAELSALLEGNDARVTAGLIFELNNAIRTTEGVETALEDLSNDEAAFNQLNYARIVTQSIYDLAGTRIPTIFGLTSGFSSLDGD